MSAEIVTPYPPGIPVLGPGEVIAAEIVAYLREAARRPPRARPGRPRARARCASWPETAAARSPTPRSQACDRAPNLDEESSRRARRLAAHHGRGGDSCTGSEADRSRWPWQGCARARGLQRACGTDAGPSSDGGTTTSTKTYTNDQYGFSLTYDDQLTQGEPVSGAGAGGSFRLRRRLRRQGRHQVVGPVRRRRPGVRLRADTRGRSPPRCPSSRPSSRASSTR